MRLTDVHAQYWARRRAPHWAQVAAKRKAAHRDVLACVNAHASADRPSNAEREAGNLCKEGCKRCSGEGCQACY